MESHRKGEATEATVIAKLKQRGVSVSIPFGDNERYDIVVETPDGTLLRVQIKTATYTDGVVAIKGHSQHTNSQGNQYKPYSGDVDYFIGYNKSLDRLYLVPEEMIQSIITLRVDEPEQMHGDMNWAETYEFDRQWPPKPQEDMRDIRRTIVKNSLSALDSIDVDAWSTSTKVPYQLLVERESGELLRIRARSVSLQEDHLQLNASGGNRHERIDYYLLYNHELDNHYLIGADEFNKSIKLRVNDTVQNRSTINWASDYELCERRTELV